MFTELSEFQEYSAPRTMQSISKIKQNGKNIPGFGKSPVKNLFLLKQTFLKPSVDCSFASDSRNLVHNRWRLANFHKRGESSSSFKKSNMVITDQR